MRYKLGFIGFFVSVAVAVATLQGFGLRVVTPAAAQALIADVLVEGNQRIEADTVRSYMLIGPGDQFDPVLIDDSLKSLFRTGLFTDVQINREGSNLVVFVDENPIINRISFEGNSEVDDDALSAEVQLRPRTVFTRARVQADVQRITAIYRRSGLFTAEVSPKIIRLPQNRVDLVFEINEGEVTSIERINFIGNSEFSDSQLRGVVSTAESAWWKILTASDNYDPDRLAYDKELLRRHYLENGFADFVVLSATAELSRDGESFFITFVVEEGPQYTFGEINIDVGRTGIDPVAVREVVLTNQGDTYDANLVDKSVEQITIEAGKLGFAFSQVRPQANRNAETLSINLTYLVQEGPRVYIERINIVGNIRTLDEVIRREIRLVEGDAYNRILVDRARRRITALDFFDVVEILERPGSSSDKVVLVVQVQEKSTGSLNFGLGVSTAETVLGNIGLEERNLLGRGQFVRLSTSLSFKRQQVDFSFTEPYFLGRRIRFGVDAFATDTDLQDESSFDSRQIGAGVRFGFPLSENSSVVFRYNVTNRQVRNVPTGASLAVASSAGTTNSSIIGFTVAYDTLDNPLEPTSGFRITHDQDLAGVGGDIFFWRAEGKAVYFHTVYEGVVVMLRGRGGVMTSLNGDDVLVIDRFFHGGESFRGFERSGIGPRDLSAGTSNDALGGQAYALGTAELSFPTGLPEAFGLRAAVFADVGTLFWAPESSSGATLIRDGADVRASVGAGLIWRSPLGPLRLDFAYAVLKEDYDITELFRFSAGTRF
jgi:outer membrane protein insertion porin family